MNKTFVQTAKNKYKSDIFFTNDQIINPNPHTRNLKFHVISADARLPLHPKINRNQEKYKSDIFNSSFVNDEFTKPHKTFKSEKTNIILGEAEPDVVKKDKTKPNYNPEPYFTHVSAASRRLKEFYGEKNYQTFKGTTDNLNKTYGTLEKEIFSFGENRGKEISNPNLTARQRKIYADHSPLSNFEFIGLNKHLTSAKSMDEKSFKSTLALVNKVNEMKSNIFYDPKKEAVYETFNPIKKEDAQLEEKKVPPKISKFSKNLWKADDEKKQNLAIKNNETKNTSNLGKKLKNLEGNINFSHKKVNLNNTIDQVFNHTTTGARKEEESFRRDIHSSFQAALGNDNLKIKKNVELSSVNQGKDFYQKNAKYLKNVDLSFQSFEIKDIPNISKLKIHEIESVYRKKGTKGNLIGQPTGEISFKVRGLGEENEFTKHLVEVNSKLQKDLKLKVQPVQVKPSKQKMEKITPSDVNWYSTHSSNFGNKVIAGKVLKKFSKNEPKLSKTYSFLDTSYKNQYGTQGIKLK